MKTTIKLSVDRKSSVEVIAATPEKVTQLTNEQLSQKYKMLKMNIEMNKRHIDSSEKQLIQQKAELEKLIAEEKECAVICATLGIK